MSALMTSTRVSSTRRNTEEFQATGKFVVSTASFTFAVESAPRNDTCHTAGKLAYFFRNG